MKPLHGVRVISIEQFGAAPYGSMFLADLGADVIKVENATGGDPARYTGPYKLGATDSEYFQTWNTNKRSVMLDLRSEQGRQALLDLAKSADALMNNLRGDLPRTLGLDYAQMLHVNPALVCLHISAYGRDNERASWPGYDYLMQAESGLMDLTGEPSGPPTRLGGPSIIDHMTGMTGIVGLLAAIVGARTTNRGCDVDVCLFDVALHQLGYAAIWSLNESHVTTRQPRSAHFSLVPVQTFPTSDGWIFIMCMTEKFWRVLVDRLEMPALLNDLHFRTQADRLLHRETLTTILDDHFKQHSTSHWLDKLQGHLPVAPVLSVAEALHSPLVESSRMVQNVPHPHRPDLRLLANPLKINGARLQQAVCSQPGADNAAVFEELRHGSQWESS